MPLYEYQCRKCKTHFEKIQKFSDPPLTRCEKCGGKLEQMMSSPAFQFKGSGWYVTDYARKQEKADGADQAASGAKDEKPSDGKTNETNKTTDNSKSNNTSKTKDKTKTPVTT